MKAFQLIPAVTEYGKFADFADEADLGSDDLILTNKYIYHPVIAELGLGCQTVFQEKFGGGEPTDKMVDAILDELRGKEYGRIIAVGGGTVIDIAKVLAVAAPEDRVDDLYDRMAEGLVKAHPLLIVPTTCGTGSEVTNISIINRISKGVKQGIVSGAMFADEAVLIPDMLMSLPYGVFATSSIDAMVHAVESYLSPNACAISEMFSIEALRHILRGWKRTLEKGGGEAWKGCAQEFLRASNYAGIAFGHAGCAAVHAMAYPLGSVHHIPHGQANQLMFADVMKKYAKKQPEGKLESLGAVLGEELGISAKEGLNGLYRLMDGVLKRAPLREHGIKEEELPLFAKNVVETQQRLLNNNYVVLTEDEILEIYRNAY